MTNMQSRSFVGFDISKKTWRKTTLKDIAKLEKGEQLNRIFLQAEGKYPVMNGGISPSGYTNTFNTRSNTVTISEGGNSCGYVNYLKENFWSGGHCYSLSKIKTSSLFLFYLLKSNEKNIQKLRVGSGLPNIQKKDLENIILSIPERSEQEKIGILFENFDKLIEDKEKKLAKLEQIKKTMLSKMFPKSGTYIPEIRFSGFKDKWKSFDLDKIGSIVAGGDVPLSFSFRKNKVNHVPIVSNGTKEKYLYGYTNQAKIIKPSVTISARGTIGYVSFLNIPFLPIVRLIVITPQAWIFAYFAYLSISRLRFETTSSGIPQLTIPMVKKLKVLIPSISEQKKISNYFEKLDRHIELQSQEIQKLKQLKHSLLANMLKIDINNQVEKAQRKEK